MSLARQKITQLCSWGTSRAVRIPKEMCERLGIDLGARISMRAGRDERGSFILMRPEAAEHRFFEGVAYVSMDDLFAGYQGVYRPSEADWGEDVGAEVVE